MKSESGLVLVFLLGLRASSMPMPVELALSIFDDTDETQVDARLPIPAMLVIPPRAHWARPL